MRPWWDSAWLWSGVGIVVFAAIAAVIAVIIIAELTKTDERR
jgi:hypothetical protein